MLMKKNLLFLLLMLVGVVNINAQFDAGKKYCIKHPASGLYVTVTAERQDQGQWPGMESYGILTEEPTPYNFTQSGGGFVISTDDGLYLGIYENGQPGKRSWNVGNDVQTVWYVQEGSVGEYLIYADDNKGIGVDLPANAGDHVYTDKTGQYFAIVEYAAGALDFSTLDGLMDKAQKALDAQKNNVGDGPGQYTEDVYNALKYTYEDVQNAYDALDSQADINQMAEELRSALSAFTPNAVPLFEEGKYYVLQHVQSGLYLTFQDGDDSLDGNQSAASLQEKGTAVLGVAQDGGFVLSNENFSLGINPSVVWNASLSTQEVWRFVETATEGVYYVYVLNADKGLGVDHQTAGSGIYTDKSGQLWTVVLATPENSDYEEVDPLARLDALMEKASNALESEKNNVGNDPGQYPEDCYNELKSALEQVQAEYDQLEDVADITNAYNLLQGAWSKFVPNPVILFEDGKSYVLRHVESGLYLAFQAGGGSDVTLQEKGSAVVGVEDEGGFIMANEEYLLGVDPSDSSKLSLEEQTTWRFVETSKAGNYYIYQMGSDKGLGVNSQSVGSAVRADKTGQQWTVVLATPSNSDIPTPTAISATPVRRTLNAVYSLDGRRVNAMTKGVYVVNGKKVMK